MSFRKTIWFTLLCVVLGTTLPACAWSKQDVAELSAEYMERYVNGAKEFDKLLPYLTAASVFEDPTAALLGTVMPVYKKAVYVQGGPQIVAVLTEVTEGAENFQYLVEKSFTSGDFSSYTGTMSFEIDPKAFHIPMSRKLKFHITRVTILQWNNSKMVHQQDFVDYVAMIRQLMAQIPLGFDLKALSE